MWSSRGGKPERTLGEHPHVLGGRVVSRKGVDLVPFMDAPPARAGALSGARRGELCVCAPGSRGGILATKVGYFGVKSTNVIRGQMGT